MPKDWREYFDARFADRRQFTVEGSEDEVSITDATGRSEVEIEIRYAEDGKLSGLFFLHPDTRGWNSLEDAEMSVWDPYFDEPFTPQTLAFVESVLAIPLHEGWKERAYYLDGEHVKSVILLGRDPRVRKTVYMENGGCLLGMFLAIRYSRLCAGRRMQSRDIVVDPMVGSV